MGFKNKLKSEKGISIIFALLFLFLCSMISMVVLSGASAVLGKSNNRELATESLTLSSALQLVRHSFGDSLLKAEESETLFSCSEHSDFVSVSPSLSVENLNFSLQQSFATAIYPIYLQNTRFFHPSKPPLGSTSTGDFTISAEGMEDVLCSYTIYPNYDILINFTIPTSNLSSQISLVFKASVSSLSTSDKTLQCSHDVVIKDELGNDQIVTEYSDITQNTDRKSVV